jgi:hypothetical protein
MTALGAPLIVRMFFFRERDNMSAPLDMTDLFQDGNGVAEPTNLPTDMYLPFNKQDYIIFKERRFVVAIQDTNQNASANGANLLQFFKQDLLKYIPKRLAYADAAVDTTNCGLYVGFLICNADGSAISTAEPRANVSYNVQFEFEDL